MLHERESAKIPENSQREKHKGKHAIVKSKGKKNVGNEEDNSEVRTPLRRGRSSSMSPRGQRLLMSATLSNSDVRRDMF